MNIQQNMDERLWDYIDGSVNSEEKSFVEQLLQTNQQWKAKYAELLEVHQLMKNHLELDEPSMRFTQNVMEEIAKYQIAPATKSYLNKKIIWGIGGFFIIMILGLIIYGFGQVNWSAPESGYGLPVDISNLDWSKFFNNSFVNVFVMVNVVLGLMLLDIYLGKKKKEAKQ